MKQVRSIPSQFETREEDGKKYVEGYFAVFDSVYNIAPGLTESVAKGAFERTLAGGDIRALVNHDTTLVLGRTKSHTLELREDERGLWGRVEINPNDSDAVNLYERVSRGDVDGCSFGFDIVQEETEVRENGEIHWTLQDVDLYEVSACTFPAYESTNIVAREKDAEGIRKRQRDAWRATMKERAKKWH